MARRQNTTAGGGGFDTMTVQAVWNKGQVIAGYDPATWRKDTCGAWINRAAYGSTAATGWEVDHIKPVAKDGTDELTNLQPLNWQNNRRKGDDWPNWACAVTA